MQEEDNVRVESLANGIAFEGRLMKESGELRGILELGPNELALVLRRAAGSAP